MPLNNTAQVLNRIRDERIRQDQLIRDGKIHGACEDPNESDLIKLPILMEEVGEVALEINDVAQDDPKYANHMHEELIQVAAVACAWAESFEEKVNAYHENYRPSTNIDYNR